MNTEDISPRSHLSVLILSLIFFFTGIAGLQRFYAGKIWTGLLWLITGGLLGIGQIVDIVFIICGKFTDKQGRPIIG